MSHVATIDLHITDLDALELACKSLGLELIRGKTEYKWYGRHVGDYPLPAGFSKDELGKCEHAIRVSSGTASQNSNAYEVGVCKRKDGKPGYTLLWDFYAGGLGLEKAIGANAGKLKQNYSAQVACKQLRKQGMRVAMRQDEKGNIKIKATH